jgi:type IV fimbrial biogenesis protein FimT
MTGFNMVELMVVMTILAVLAAFAAPEFQSTIQNYRIRNAADELEYSIQYARTEAIRRGRNVVIQRANCPAANWGCGWRAFVDTDNDQVQDAGEPTVRETAAPRDISIVLGSFMGTARLRVDPFGETRNPGTFTIDTANGNSSECTLLVMSSGLRIRRQPCP